MTNASAPCWQDRRTDETRGVERILREAGFERVDAYRYNSASIRVRVVDPRFEGLSTEKRDEMVEPHIEKLPEETQADIMFLLTVAPSELEGDARAFKHIPMNAEFEDPSPSSL